MTKIINFRARSKSEFELQDKPYPASKNLPKWFTDMVPYESGGENPKIHIRGGHRNKMTNATFKKCVPMLDSMTSGYIVPLWADVLVEYIDGNHTVQSRTVNEVFQQHGSNTEQITPPHGYHKRVYKYLNCWIPETPKGYSCLIVPPLGHHDLIVKAVPAIVDTDRSKLELVFPVWFKEGFEGVIEKGTPIVQIIPFKRDNWESTFNYYEDGEYFFKIQEKNFNATLVGNYIKNFWSHKKFK